MDGALEHLQSHRYGVLLADGLAHEIRFIVDGATGELVFPVDRGMLEAEELVLFIPRDLPAGDHELQLLLSAREIDGNAGLGDRWTAYHGAPEKPLFASCEIAAGKFDGAVIEVDELVCVNAVRGAEGRMLTKANTDKARLRGVCARATGVDVQNPVAVGADQYGVELRAAFGIVRLFFAETAKDAADAEQLLGVLLGECA
jgi:hypothetical protein